MSAMQPPDNNQSDQLTIPVGLLDELVNRIEQLEQRITAIEQSRNPSPIASTEARIILIDPPDWGQ